MMELVRASGLFTGTEEIVDAGIWVSDGVAIASGSFAEMSARDSSRPVRVLNGVVFPALANAHVHLELSGLHGKIAKGLGFLPWLEALMALRVYADTQAMQAACDALARYATNYIGEIGNSGLAVPFMRSAALGGIVFDEVFGLDEARTQARLEELLRLTAEYPIHRTVTPHALHSVHPNVLRLLADRPGPLSVHLAEYPAERQYLTHGDGPLARWLGQRGPLPPCPGQSSVAYARALGLLREGTLAVHLTDATADELATVRDAGALAVLCPRSNMYIEKRLPPLRDILRLGVPFALGTDSLASNDSLDVLEEARVLWEAFPEVSPSTLVNAATHVGAKALGFPKGGLVSTENSVYLVEGSLGQDSPCTFLLKNTVKERRRLYEFSV